MRLQTLSCLFCKELLSFLKITRVWRWGPDNWSQCNILKTIVVLQLPAPWQSPAAGTVARKGQAFAQPSPKSAGSACAGAGCRAARCCCLCLEQDIYKRQCLVVLLPPSKRRSAPLQQKWRCFDSLAAEWDVLQTGACCGEMETWACVSSLPMPWANELFLGFCCCRQISGYSSACRYVAQLGRETWR